MARPRASLLSEIQHFSTKQEDVSTTTRDAESPSAKESFEETVKRMQKDGKSKSAPPGDDEKRSFEVDGFLRQAAEIWSNFSKEIGVAWQELLRAGERKDINKKIRHPEATVEGEAAYTGPVEIMVIDEAEKLTAWERMQRRLTEAPIIQGMANCIHYWHD